MKFVLFAALAVFVVGCNSGGTTQIDPGEYQVQTVVTGLEVPWSIAWTPDGKMLVTERPGRVRMVENGVLRPDPLLTIADVNSVGEAGLMGMALHPSFASNNFVYLAYASQADSGRVKVVRYTRNGYSLEAPSIIISNIPAGNIHAGCRIKFGPDGKLYITTGEAGTKELAQDMTSLGGKLLRLNDDGSIPSDNPFVGQQNVREEIWVLGCRNPQGLDWQPGTNTLFETEHGPSGGDAPGGGDEVNIIEPGKNYGWPTIHHTQTASGLESPLLEYTPAIAPAGATFYRGSRLAAYQNNFFFACLRGRGIQRVVLNGSTVVSQEKLFTNYGRLREVAEGPDGALYFTTSNRDGRGSPNSGDDKILRIVPAG